LERKVDALTHSVESMNRVRWTTEAAILDQQLMSMALQFAGKRWHRGSLKRDRKRL
jgi:hypothetical protein